MNGDQLSKIVERYSRKIEAGYGDIKVTRLPDQKTVFVERIDGVGRAVMMDKYQVDGATYWPDTARAARRFISVWLLKAVTTNHIDR